MGHEYGQYVVCRLNVTTVSRQRVKCYAIIFFGSIVFPRHEHMLDDKWLQTGLLVAFSDLLLVQPATRELSGQRIYNRV